MKYLIIIIMFIGCIKQNVEQKEDLRFGIDGVYFETIEIEGCEYLGSDCLSCNRALFTHKGNCKNPIHECN